MKAYLIALIIVCAGLALHQWLITLKIRSQYRWGKNWLVKQCGYPFNPYKDQYHRAVFTFIGWCLAIVVLIYFTLKA